MEKPVGAVFLNCHLSNLLNVAVLYFHHTLIGCLDEEKHNQVTYEIEN